MRIVEADLDRSNGRMPSLWSLVKSPDEFWGDLSTHGRRLLKELLEGTMQLWRDEWVQVDWHKPAARASGDGPRRYRNGFYVRKRWPTALGTLGNVRVPRCREKGLTERMFARLEDHREALGESVIDMLLAGVSTRRVGELLERIIDLPVSPARSAASPKDWTPRCAPFTRGRCRMSIAT